MPGVGGGQELLEFLVGLEDVSGEVAGGLDRPGVLSRQQFRGRQPRPGWRTYRAACAGCAYRDLGRVEFMAAVRRKPARASSRSVRLCGWAGLAGLPSWEFVVLWQGEGRGFKFAWRLRTTCSAVRSSLSCAGSTVI